ncbi:MAG: flagellar hook capping FlgD N-terminal domain-containing protein [Candidatus Zixiibacteriota bacterium]
MGIISPLATDTNGNPVQTGHLKELGKDDFLQLLVAKLTHQDPMEPMKDEAFIADLAQFSSLEQLANLNESINNSLDLDYLQMQTINNTMATSLIGKEVKASYNSVYLDGDNSPHINFSLTEFAKDITVSIYDESGALVRTINEQDFGIGENSMRWDGRDNNGNRLSDGFYTVDISGENADGEKVDVSTYIVGLVKGVSYHDGAAFLNINGLEIPLAMVNQINLYNDPDAGGQTDDSSQDDGSDEG